MDIHKIVDGLSDEELIGQLLCYDVYGKDDFEKNEKIFKHIHPGAFFFKGMTVEQIKKYKETAEKYAPLPVLVASDVEEGPGSMIIGEPTLTQEMAWGAANDPDLVYEAGVAIGERCRECGMNYNFSPIVDLSLNFESPTVNVRAISDDPDAVIRLASAYVKGLQKNGNMAATIKHFPGEGVDSRNSHFLTTINHMSQEEWMASYGKVYKALIEAGSCSVMVGHSSLPCFEDEIDPIFGPKPACQSYNLITKLLKGKLGFDGVVVSDSMAMIGVAARVEKTEDIAINFINAGGDMVLFPEPNDFDTLLSALHDGRIKRERVIDAVTRILRMKEKLHLLDKGFVVKKESTRKIEEIGEDIASKAIKIVRNVQNVLPLNLNKGQKVLMLDVFEPYFHRNPEGDELKAFKDTLESYGLEVDEIFNIDYLDVEKIIDKYDAVIACSKISSNDYHGGTMRVGWYNIMTFWRGYVLRHPKFVFISFGDPYKLYDFPYLKTYVNAFSSTYPSQVAAAKAVLGKIKCQGKNPVSFHPYFEREI